MIIWENIDHHPRTDALLKPIKATLYSVIWYLQVVQDIIDEVCAKLGVVSQMEQEEYTVFAMVESGTILAPCCGSYNWSLGNLEHGITWLW